MSAPSVLFINRVYYPSRGATGRILRDVAEAFAKAGWSVTVLTTGADDDVSRLNGVQITRIKAPQTVRSLPAYLWVWLKLFIKALRMSRRDIVITMTDPPMLVVIGRIFSRIKGAAHIHWCQDLFPDLLPALDMKLPNFILKALRRLSRRSMKEADRVIVIGRCMARHLVETGMSLSDLTLITNWPDREIFSPSKPEEKMYDGQMPLVQDERPRFRLIYAGAIGRSHSMKTLMEAVLALNESQPDIEFVFIGDDVGHERMARQRDRYGLSNVRMLPFQPPGRLRYIMESADVHLVSLTDEAAGLMVPSKFYSALAAGRPCIYVGPPGTEIAQVNDYFHCGLNVANGDSNGLIRAIMTYRESEAAWRSAQDGAIRAREVFLPEQSIQALIKRASQVYQGR